MSTYLEADAQTNDAADAVVAIGVVSDPVLAPAEADVTETSRPHAAEDVTCPICLEVLLRPVSLSCGHRLCRGCWLRVLQGRDVRATANRTGTVACPLGRCQVRPIVPAVDAALARDLESQFSSQLSRATLPEVDEAKLAAEVNAWAAGGCKLDHPEEKAWVEAVAQVEQAERCRMISQRFLLITIGLLACVELVAFVVFLTDMQAGWGWVQTPNCVLSLATTPFLRRSRERGRGRPFSPSACRPRCSLAPASASSSSDWTDGVMARSSPFARRSLGVFIQPTAPIPAISCL